MIITKTPFRISFFGGGTDYPGWYRENGGAVLSTTIDKYCYITCRFLPPFFDHKHRIVYSHIENVKELDEINHPSVREVLKWAQIAEGLEIHHDGDLPARSGLGSSSAFTVGLINAIGSLKGKRLDKLSLAKDAINIEQNIIGENVGSQDQISASYGGLNKILFHQDDSFLVEPMVIKNFRKRELSDHLMLFFTGFSRIASEIAKSQIENLKNRQIELIKIGEMVDQAIELLQNDSYPIEEFGKLLGEGWRFKRSLSKNISTPEIDLIYEIALNNGAIGGKILGAGGGGFMLLFAKPEYHSKIRDALSKLVFVPFKFENFGSQTVLYQPDGF